MCSKSQLVYIYLWKAATSNTKYEQVITIQGPCVLKEKTLICPKIIGARARNLTRDSH